MRATIIIILAISFLTSCSNNHIANKKDYSIYLQSIFHKKKIETNNTEIEFWQNKLLKDTGSYLYKKEIAQQKIKRFNLQGNPTDLQEADSLLLICSAKLSNKEPSIYYSLIQNAITQHKFKTAATYLKKLNSIGGDAYIINLLSFDVNMEIGNYEKALFALQTMGNKASNFDYLIRNSKYNDHIGKSKESMNAMIKAYEYATKNKNKAQEDWCLTNLADKYSHEGDIKQAYKYYLKALEKDSANLYALKGIAKICFVEDNNITSANEIVNFLQMNGTHPDNYLLLAEMARVQSNETSKENNEKAFFNLVSNKRYGNMYNKYLIEQYLENKSQYKLALQQSISEIDNRATPETYAWLAYAYFKNNEKQKALDTLKEHVLEKTHEPEALYLASIILHKADDELCKKLVKKCSESKFELGPSKYKTLLSLKM